jgi:hypothetical protein
VEELCTPLLDGIADHRRQLAALTQTGADSDSRLGLLEDLFLHKNEKNNAFEKINEKMAESVIFHRVSEVFILRIRREGSRATHWSV